MRKGYWESYSLLDGLPDVNVFAVLQDTEGHLWFGTRNGGVSRYDGDSFVNFTTKDGLPHNCVLFIMEDSKGYLWFGTPNGASRYDGHDFVNFTTEDGLPRNSVSSIVEDSKGHLWFGTGGTEDGLPRINVSSIMEDSKGYLWFGTGGGGVSRYDGDSLTNFTIENGLAVNDVISILEDRKGRIWFGTRNGVISCYDGNDLLSLTEDDRLTYSHVTPLLEDREGNIWFGIYGTGVNRYDGKRITNFTIEDGLAHNKVWSILEDSEGHLWFTTFGGGVSRYDGQEFVNYTMEDGLADNRVLSMTEDREGNLWFGTHGGGVSRYEKDNFTTFVMEDNLVYNSLVCISESREVDFWIGNENSVICYNGDRFLTFSIEDVLPGNGYTTILEDSQGNLWFGVGEWHEGSGSGICRYDRRSFITFTTEDGLAHNNVKPILEDTQGNMWFGTHGGGVSLYDGDSFTNFTTQDGLADDFILCITEDQDGNLWFGTREGGVSCYDGQNFKTFTTEDGLAHNQVWSILQGSKGILWIGTYDGISRYDGRSFQTITVKHGLSCNYIHSILEDREGNFWIGTNGGGVCKYDGENFQDITTLNGLPDDSVGSIMQDKAGNLWFRTRKGITRYTPSPQKVKPRVRITQMIADKVYENPENTESSSDHVTFEYKGLSFRTRSDRTKYTYKLEGRDKDWCQATRERSVRYEDLSPGEYVFHVKAIDRDLSYSEPAILRHTVQPNPILTELMCLRHEVEQKYRFDSIIGNSHGIRLVRVLMERAIDSGLTVLIIGETGTGKELVAKAIHYNSPRKDGPLLDRNCGAMPRELLASDLFGHRKGAFTGATEDKMGLFEAASGGTLLLDEIGEMSEDAQSHLLRVLEERKVQRLGEHTSRDVDVRIIAMTNRELVQEVTAGRFRKDLYHRFNEFPIHIPPLRERQEDIPILAERFLQEYSKEQEKQFEGFAPGTFEMLQSYPWPGNVRELKNAVRRAAALGEEGDQIQTYHFPLDITQEQSLIQESIAEGVGLSAIVDRFQRRVIEDALRQCNGNKAQSARMLQIHRPNLIRLMKRLGIE